jgi:hypothetical protein
MNYLPAAFACAALCATSIAVMAKTVPTPKIPDSEIQNTLRTDPIAISIDDLEPAVNVGDWFQRSPNPKAISAFDGKQVQMIGQIFSWHKNGRPAKLYFNGDTCQGSFSFFPQTAEAAPLYLIPISFREGIPDRFAPHTVEIEGRLIIKPVRKKGVLTHIYQIDDATIRPAEHEEGFGPSIVYFGC